MQRNTEQEWQFTAPALGAARDWLASQATESTGRHFSRRPTLELQDTYFDSADWMIYRAGFALRLRKSRTSDAANAESSEITLKSLSSARSGGLTRRQEYSQATVSNIADALGAGDGLGERIRELIGARPLRELFRVNTSRERQCLLEAENDLPLAEIDLDDTTIEAAGVARSLQRVEVECLHAEPAAIEPMVQNLRSAAGLVPVEASKFQTGLDIAGLHPGVSLEPGMPALLATQPFEQALRLVLRHFFALVLEQEPKLRAGSAQAVHDMRVAARHLDILLRAGRHENLDWAMGCRSAVRTLVKRLGGVRDCDVQLEHVDAALRAEPEQREALLPLRQRIAGDRDTARAGLLRELDSERHRSFQDSWLAELRSILPPAGSAAAGEPLTGAVALDLIRRQARKLRKRADALESQSTPDDFHRIRIAGKRLRYLLDVFEGLYGPAARDYGRALAKMQNVLGEFHDAAVREQHFAELVSRSNLPPATVFVIGRLVERDSLAFERCRRRFAKAYRRIRRRRWRELLASMQRQAAACT